MDGCARRGGAILRILGVPSRSVAGQCRGVHVLLNRTVAPGQRDPGIPASVDQRQSRPGDRCRRTREDLDRRRPRRRAELPGVAPGDHGHRHKRLDRPRGVGPVVGDGRSWKGEGLDEWRGRGQHVHDPVHPHDLPGRRSALAGVPESRVVPQRERSCRRTPSITTIIGSGQPTRPWRRDRYARHPGRRRDAILTRGPVRRPLREHDDHDDPRRGAEPRVRIVRGVHLPPRRRPDDRGAPDHQHRMGAVTRRRILRAVLAVRRRREGRGVLRGRVERRAVESRVVRVPRRVTGVERNRSCGSTRTETTCRSRRAT